MHMKMSKDTEYLTLHDDYSQKQVLRLHKHVLLYMKVMHVLNLNRHTRLKHYPIGLVNKHVLNISHLYPQRKNSVDTVGWQKPIKTGALETEVRSVLILLTAANHGISERLAVCLVLWQY